MTKEKQIEEIAKNICGMKNGCVGCMFNKSNCYERKDAEAIYNAGYRKASEVAREIFEEIERVLTDNEVYYRQTDKMREDFIKLKKKYTEEGK